MWLSAAYLDNLISRGKRLWHSRRPGRPDFTRVFDFAQFLGATPRRGRALVSFAPWSLLDDARRGQSSLFNPTGASLEIARALNELGYVVDMISFLDRDFIPERDYDIFIGHANINWRQISDKLPAHAARMTYMTGCYWRDFEAKTEVAYQRFCASRNLPREAVPVSRTIENEEYSTVNADLVVCLGEETAKTFLPVAKKVVAINNAAYLEEQLPLESKDWATARKHFLYYGGAGNIQKGVDLLIEAFVQKPDCHLHLYAPLEPEILKAYRRELAAPNIHYARPWRFFPRRFAELPHQCAFTLLCGGFATGQSTALLGCLGYGLIPVVNRESDITINGSGICIERNDVAAVKGALLRASQSQDSWLIEAARKTKDIFRKYYSPDAFRHSFKKCIEMAISRNY